ncbi:MAG: HlyD family efflux transporter periplasmic adaptor subunit [Acidobacteria bacterium]|nr:HlyD family efflux transporter periplasmic adaptor subunit [Acidobacteriota bacterium]
MDVPREGAAKKRLIRRIAIAAVLLTAAGGVTYWLSKLKPAAVSVEYSTVWLDTVKRGPMLRNVRGMGTLVPEEILIVPAISEGRVDKIHLRAGATVRADTVLLELSNPELQLAAFDAEWQVKAAEATIKDLRVKLETQRLDQVSAQARVASEYTQAKLQANRDEALIKLGLKSDLEYKLTKAKADELAGRSKIEDQRVKIFGDSIEAQVAAQLVNIEKLRAAWELKKQQVAQLRVRAGAEGILQQMAVEVGQKVLPGAVLAKVAQPTKLKAELKIAETQMKDVQHGEQASIDTRNGIIPGHVVRIDPAAVNGTVTVDIKLDGPLPPGARPDLSVDGNVDLERIADVVYVGRPVYGQPNSTITLFKLVPGTNEAIRVPVKLGRGSVNHIEIVEGLTVGDTVILSGMSQYDSQNRIQLKR